MLLFRKFRLSQIIFYQIQGDYSKILVIDQQGTFPSELFRLRRENFSVESEFLSEYQQANFRDRPSKSVVDATNKFRLDFSATWSTSLPESPAEKSTHIQTRILFYSIQWPPNAPRVCNASVALIRKKATVITRVTGDIIDASMRDRSIKGSFSHSIITTGLIYPPINLINFPVYSARIGQELRVRSRDQSCGSFTDSVHCSVGSRTTPTLFAAFTCSCAARL